MAGRGISLLSFRCRRGRAYSDHGLSLRYALRALLLSRAFGGQQGALESYRILKTGVDRPVLVQASSVSGAQLKMVRIINCSRPSKKKLANTSCRNILLCVYHTLRGNLRSIPIFVLRVAWGNEGQKNKARQLYIR
jgi:hypothetical protein